MSIFVEYDAQHATFSQSLHTYHLRTSLAFSRIGNGVAFILSYDHSTISLVTIMGWDLNSHIGPRMRELLSMLTHAFTSLSLDLGIYIL